MSSTSRPKCSATALAVFGHALVVIVGIACSNSARRPIDPERAHAQSAPSARIAVNGSLPMTMFTLSKCTSAGDSPRVHAIVIRQLQSDDHSGEVHERTVCHMRTIDDGGEIGLAQWTYGEAAAGFRVLACEPLERQGRYVVSVIGSAVGSLEFSFDLSGHVSSGRDACSQ